MESPGGSVVKNLPAMLETQVQFLGQEDSQEKEMEPTPVFLSEKSCDRGAWQATVHGVSEEMSQLSN